MNAPQLIKTLLGIAVNTEDLSALRNSPENFVEHPADAAKLRDLFTLMDLMEEKEANYNGHNG